MDIAEFCLEEEEILDKDGGFTGKRKLRDASVGLRALETLCKTFGVQHEGLDETMPEKRK